MKTISMIKTQSAPSKSLALSNLKPSWPPLVTALIFLLMGIAIVGSTAAGDPSNGIRIVLFSFFFGIIWVAMQASPKLGICALVTYLCFLGGLRRSLIFELGWQSFDPLVLVGPAIAIFFFFNIIVTKNLNADTTISKLHLVVVVIMILEIANPLQGAPVVGVYGALIYLVPMIWFFVGRTMGSLPNLRRLYLVVCIISIIAAAYALKQTLFGFSPEEKAWIDDTNIESLNVGQTIRAVSFFTSGAEYCFCTCIGAVLCWAAFLRGSKVAFLPIPFLFVAIVLESSRGALLGTLATMTVLSAIQGKSVVSWLPRLFIAAAIATVGLIYSMQQLQSTNTPVQTARLVQHETQGILNPNDVNASTAGVHSNMAVIGLVSGFEHPLGLGLGATTDAAGRFGGQVGTTEVDVTNMFESLGFVGGILYVCLIIVILVTAFNYWRTSRSLESLCIVGVILLTVGLWLTGEQYSTVLIIWFSIGSLDRNWRAIGSQHAFTLPKSYKELVRQMAS